MREFKTLIINWTILVTSPIWIIPIMLMHLFFADLLSDRLVYGTKRMFEDIDDD
jgi:hypothetical protein